jgi:hypothetical protein
MPQLPTVVKIPDVLGVTLDELGGRQEDVNAEGQIHNPELHRLYKKVVRSLLDGMILKHEARRWSEPRAK